MRTKLIPIVLAASTVLTALPVAAGAATTTPAKTSCATPGSGYGQMFPKLAGASWESSALDALSAAMIAPPETNPTPEGQRDAEENPDIPAGYTYFGQFVDHDLTLDDRPNDLTTPTPVSALKNLRTPQLDLDSVYGRGPTASPTLYEADGMHMNVGAALTGGTDTGSVDLPRAANGQAIIGDPRNDENRIVAAIHALFLRFHNQVVDRIKAENPKLANAEVFTRARQQVTWHYQWIILNDFLPAIVGRQTTDGVVRNTPQGWKSNLRFYNACQQMPIEFSVAAYRFGHSMVRGLYRINDSVDRLPVFSGTYQPGSDLAGFSPAPSNFGMTWDLFMPRNGAALGRTQLSYKLDGSLTYSLSLLPLPTTGSGPANLAKRNLLRSQQLGLPSGQAVARAMGITPLRDDQILVGKATGDATEASAITSVSPTFAGNAPLWAYILAEATANAYPVSGGKITGGQRAPYRLGPVGGRIVAETFVGLLQSDKNSVLNNRFAPNGPNDNFRALIDTVTSGGKPGPRPPAPNPARPQPGVPNAMRR